MPMAINPSRSVLMKPRSSAGRLDCSTWLLKNVSSRDIGIPRSDRRDQRMRKRLVRPIARRRVELAHDIIAGVIRFGGSYAWRRAALTQSCRR
jgi:hypothetical protein